MMTLKNTFIAIIKLSRPFNVLIGMFSVFIAIFVTGKLQPLSNISLAIISYGILIHAAANTINDYFDVDIDRINKPHRPIPAGQISGKTAFITAMIEFALGVLLALFINLTAFLLALVFSILLFFYSYKLKKIAILGNISVSLATASAFISGGVAVNRVRETVIPAVFAFFYHFGREIIKDIQDVEGDLQQHANTFPIVYGIKASLYLTTASYLVLMIITYLPFALDIYGYKYFLIILFGVYPVIIIALIRIWRNQHPSNLGKMSTLLKINMMIGLLAIFFG